MAKVRLGLFPLTACQGRFEARDEKLVVVGILLKIAFHALHPLTHGGETRIALDGCVNIGSRSFGHDDAVLGLQSGYHGLQAQIEPGIFLEQFAQTQQALPVKLGYQRPSR